VSHIDTLRSAGSALQGVGIQYYPNAGTLIGSGDQMHSPARIESTLQNLSTEGVALSLNEFGVGVGSLSNPATILTDSVRLMFGAPQATGFFMWGFQAENGGGNLFRPAAALYTVNTSDWTNWTITDSGKAWQDLLGIQDWDGNPNNAWTTHVTPTVDANGNVTFTGFFGDYNIGNQSGFKNLTLVKGTSGYSLSLAAPPTWSFWNTANTGAWSAGSNWSSGGIPNAAGRTAYFGPAGAARSVNVDSPQTVGMIALDSANSYTFNGPSTITLSGSAGVAAIYVNNGSHQIDAPLALNDDTTVTVAPSNSVLTVTNLQPSNVTLTKAGAGALVVNNIRANSLSVSAGSLKISPNGTDSGTSNVTALSIAGGSMLDLADNALVVDYSGASPLATIKSQLISGYAGGGWTGNGITSSTAAAVAADGANLHKTALGYAEASALGVSTFAGQGVDDTAVLIRYTLAGDANLDLMVDTIDFKLKAISTLTTRSTRSISICSRRISRRRCRLPPVRQAGKRVDQRGVSCLSPHPWRFSPSRFLTCLFGNANAIDSYFTVDRADADDFDSRADDAQRRQPVIKICGDEHACPQRLCRHVSGRSERRGDGEFHDQRQ
jgi:hypothetical protein